MEKSREGRVVCVTGGSGYIASWLVNLLLLRGYTVRASLTNPDDPKKTQHLRGFDGAEERLQLFKANLTEEGAFDAVVDGCEAVFHAASPVIVAPKDPQNELIGPAVNGTLNVLRSCAKVAGIKRVVLTSSMASATFNGKPLTHDVVVDETWFSDPAFCEKNKLWYHLSKTLAEEAAWKFAKESGIDMVTINPGWVIGPFLQPNLNLTLEIILNQIKGTTFPNEVFRFVDVRDVAYAHILAYEKASAKGRYCMVGNVTHLSEFLDIVSQHFPALSLPRKCADEKPFVEKYEVSKQKVGTELGLEYTPLEVTIKDTVQCFNERGFLHI